MFKLNIKVLNIINSFYANTLNEIFFSYAGIFSSSSPSATSIMFLSLAMRLQRKSEITTRAAVEVAWMQHWKR
jgi:hypothetical protein